MMLPGLLSVTFRKLSPAEIIRLLEHAQIKAIEWGGDIHVPHGDTAKAAEVKKMGKDSGITVASYGSYYRVGCPEMNAVSFDRVLETAVVLEAPSIRVWAGSKGSDKAGQADWDAVVEDAAAIAEQAASAGITVDLEYHGGTLTDTSESAKRLLGRLPARNIRCHWQRPVGMPLEESKSDFREILPRMGNLHVYHWVDGSRRPLIEGAAEWRELLGVMSGHRDELGRNDRSGLGLAGVADRGQDGLPPIDRYALLEFVRDDLPEQFLQDAAVLKSLLREFV